MVQGGPGPAMESPGVSVVAGPETAGDQDALISWTGMCRIVVNP